MSAADDPTHPKAFDSDELLKRPKSSEDVEGHAGRWGVQPDDDVEGHGPRWGVQQPDDDA